MPYREKIAWLSLVAMAATFGPYFVITAMDPSVGETLPDLPQLTRLAIAAVAQMVLLGAGHLILRQTSPEDARTPLDERDRAIMNRSMTLAYYVLIGGMILIGCVMPFSSGGWSIINAALLMIIVAEVVHYGVAVFSYRRQT